MWTKVVSIITEIDCLISLAIASGQSELQMSRPEFVPNEGEYQNRSLYEIKDMVHPCVKMSAGRTFIPNDTYVEPSSGKEGILLVTGPNMGGKSTILRQNCLAIILA